MRVKICGLTNLDDALAALDAGADLLGFIFYAKSPRVISLDAGARIISDLQSPVIKVGLFVNAPADYVAAVLQHCGLDLAQLHGDETVETVAALKGRAYKAFRGPGEQHAAFAAARIPSPPNPLSQRERGSAFPSSSAFPSRPGRGARGEGNEPPAFLIDAHVPGAYGGTGQTADWAAAGEIARRYPILLAGGLTPENVADAVAQVQPWGVDVSSGVERAPGRKDHVKVRLFVERAKRAGEKVSG